jgi:hypothetical protein
VIFLNAHGVHKCELNRAGKIGDYDLRWVLLPNSFLKSGSLFFLERQFELDR